MLRYSIGLSVIASALATAAVLAQRPVVRTADPIARGLKESDFPRTIAVTDNVYTYEDFHAGAEKFTTTNMFVVTDEGVLVADGQGSPAETKGLVDAIRKVTPQPINARSGDRGSDAPASGGRAGRGRHQAGELG
jgi:hypothetical protein